MKKKIAIITDAIEKGPISFGNYTKNFLMKLLKIKGKNIDIILIHGKKNDEEIYKNIKEIIIPFPKRRKTKNILVNFFSLVLYQLKELVRNYKIKKFCENEQVDILHIPNVGRNAPSLVYLIVNFKLIVTNHGMANLILPSQLCWRKYKKIMHMLCYIEYFKWKFLFKNKIDMLISVSDLSKRIFIKKIGLPQDKITSIHHGVDHKIFRFFPNKEEIFQELLEKYRISNLFILHVSSYEPRKNVKNLIKAFSLLKKKKVIKEKLILIGNGFHLLKPFINKLRLESEIFLLGHVPLEDLPKFYNLAKFFCFPSFYESFGMPILEAMACGCPVITSNISACPEVAGDAALLVNPYSVEQIAEAMQRLIEDSQLRKELKKKGLKRAKEFTWEKCARKHLSAYKKILKNE